MQIIMMVIMLYDVMSMIMAVTTAHYIYTTIICVKCNNCIKKVFC